MYLSRLILDRRMRSRQLRRDIRSPYEMHRTIMRAFPDGLAAQGSDGRVLWRLDLERRTGRAALYVLSAEEPDWSALAEFFPGYLAQPSAVRDDYPPRLARGQLLRFRFRANPSKREKETGKRIGLVDEESQVAWLRRKGEAGGFAVREAIVVREDQPDALAKGRKNGHKLSLLSVRFEGVLQVIDADAFVKTLRSGIGPGKAFGFGLLSVAPCR